MIDLVGVKTLTAAVGAMMGSMVAVFTIGASDHTRLVETITAGGLGAALSVVVVRWLLGQYNNAITRLAKLEDERVVIIRQTVGALTHVTDQIAVLVLESRKRGDEITKLMHELQHRPCIAGQDCHSQQTKSKPL